MQKLSFPSPGFPYIYSLYKNSKLMVQIRRVALLALMQFCSFIAVAQEKASVTLEDVFRKNVFRQETVQGINWMKDGQYYSSLVKKEFPQVVKINVETGEEVGVLINGRDLGINFTDYTFNNDESKALLGSEMENIYRRSTKGVYHVLDLATGDLQQLMNGRSE